MCAQRSCDKSNWRRLAAGLTLGVAMWAIATMVGATAASAATIRVSVNSAGGQADNHSWDGEISANGRFVVFESEATDLVGDDTNGMRDIFVHNRAAKKTTLVSRSSAGIPANGNSYRSAISVGGRYVAFVSDASNLVADDTNAAADVFVHDRVTKKIWLVSRSSNGVQGNSSSWYPSISANGRYVSFSSKASNLVDGDTNGEEDIFVHDRVMKKTTCVSRGSAGAMANGWSTQSSISANGRYIVFASYASNLVGDDTNAALDVFLYDRVTKRTTRVSRSSAGTEGNGHSYPPTITANGRFVAFGSAASNLTAGDTNGVEDVFVHDRRSKKTTLASLGDAGLQGDGTSSSPSLSKDGRFVSFYSAATNLVAGDANGVEDIFVRDRLKGRTRLVSRSSAGAPGDGGSYSPSITANGRFVAFSSEASTLVADDTNAKPDVFVVGPLR